MLDNVPTVEQQVLSALDRLQVRLLQREEWTHSDNMRNLKETLQSPLFNHILTLQQSLRTLKSQLDSFPADTDFNFSSKGHLILSSVISPTESSPTNRSPAPTQAPPPAFDLYKWIIANAKGRQTERVVLPRPPSGGLGFSVVGLNPAGSSCQGVYVKHVQPGGVAQRSGGLQQRDQILVINGRALKEGVSQQEALSLLQSGDCVELVIAREPSPETQTQSPAQRVTQKSERPQSAAASTPRIDTSLWGHVEEIELVNDGSGLGFGIVGGKSGVVVRTLLPGGVAHRDGRLRTGDHILSIGDSPSADLTSDQVVAALQACGSRVAMVIARDYRGQRSAGPPPPPGSAPVSALAPPLLPDSAPVTALAPPPLLNSAPVTEPASPAAPPPRPLNLEGYEIHEVSLNKKPGQSLGISIVGHNPRTSQDAVGVFVKTVVPGSAADQSGNIRVHDRLLMLNDISLHGRSNQQVLEVMKQTGQNVLLTLVRRKRAPERSLDRVERGDSGLFLKKSVRRDESDENQASEEQLREKWEKALGPNYRVLVVELDPVIKDDEELQKSSKLLPVHTLRLGVELDSFDGHHYISSVVPEGAVDLHGALRPEDELLEVNHVQLYGKSRREVISFLKEVPPPFTLVCCRLLGPDQDMDQDQDSDRDSETGPTLQQDQRQESRLEPKTRPSVEEMELKLSSLLCQTEARDEAMKQELSEPLVSEEEEEEEQEEGEEEEGEEEEGELAMWAEEVLPIELNKDPDRGLGFSILDYQDPLDPGRCVFVVRSLVPAGSAQRAGGLLPGDQLVSVNSAPLARLTLSEAVELLKTAPSGRVRLGVRKPLTGPGLKLPLFQVEAGGAGGAGGAGCAGGAGGAGGAGCAGGAGAAGAVWEQEEELILDGGPPRYSSGTSDLRPPSYSSGTSDLRPPGYSSGTSDLRPPGYSSGTSDLRPPGYSSGTSDPSSPGYSSGTSDPRPPGYSSGTSDLRPPGYSSGTSDLVLGPGASDLEEGPGTSDLTLEMAVDEEEVPDPTEEQKPPPPSWDEWRLSLGRARSVETEEVSVRGESRASEADSELTLTDTDTESVRIINTERRRRRGQTHQPIRGAQSDLPQREEGEGEETPPFSHWGPARRVQVWAEPGQSLGLSIVGGRHVIKRLRNGEELKGIFIKQVLDQSPAAMTGRLKTGDKIIEVNGVDLRTASHEEAVAAIKSAQSPVLFVVQSLSNTPRPVSVLDPSIKHRVKKSDSPKPVLAPPTLRDPPPYKPPSQSGGGSEPDQEQGLL